MVVTISSSKTSSEFIDKLQADYPYFKFINGDQEHWSPGSQTITYNADEPVEQLRFGVLHELAHAQLKHNTYASDFELLKLESEAWALAAEIGKKYHVEITDEHIQSCLDTYRDWLHRRSSCPACGVHVLQQDSENYHCFNCQTEWKVSSGRFVRPYRRTR